MKIAFLNLCHCDPDIVKRTASRLTVNENFHMYIHVDAKSDIEPFYKKMYMIPNIYFIKNRYKIYWGGFNAIKATIEMIKEALGSGNEYDYFVLLQNLDYPIKSNTDIENYFKNYNGIEFIRGCNIAKTKEWHFAKKYKIYNDRDNDFYINNKNMFKKNLQYVKLGLYSITRIFFNGVIKENNHCYSLHYGAAQWAITRNCAQYIVNFYDTHPKFNIKMKHIQFPDEEYFQTIVHNSHLKYNCYRYDEPLKLWLVNWRNLHYFEYPKEITVMTENDFDTIMAQENVLFIRKVKTGISDKLLDMLDEKTII